jgi:hypothetical protein
MFIATGKLLYLPSVCPYDICSTSSYSVYAPSLLFGCWEQIGVHYTVESGAFQMNAIRVIAELCLDQCLDQCLTYALCNFLYLRNCQLDILGVVIWI